MMTKEQKAVLFLVDRVMEKIEKDEINPKSVPQLKNFCMLQAYLNVMRVLEMPDEFIELITLTLNVWAVEVIKITSMEAEKEFNLQNN